MCRRGRGVSSSVRKLFMISRGTPRSAASQVCKSLCLDGRINSKLILVRLFIGSRSINICNSVSKYIVKYLITEVSQPMTALQFVQYQGYQFHTPCTLRVPTPCHNLACGLVLLLQETSILTLTTRPLTALSQKDENQAID